MGSLACWPALSRAWRRPNLITGPPRSLAGRARRAAPRLAHASRRRTGREQCWRYLAAEAPDVGLSGKASATGPAASIAAELAKSGRAWMEWESVPVGWLFTCCRWAA